MFVYYVQILNTCIFFWGQFQQNKELSVYDHNIANFDENVAKILVMIQTSTVQNIVRFYKDQQITHLISITNMSNA